jgi:REP element-mobilizing transposase RayT
MGRSPNRKKPGFFKKPGFYLYWAAFPHIPSCLQSQIMPRRTIELLPGQVYHVYNRGANRGTIFLQRENYLFFLRRFREKVDSKQATVIAWCLMPNHFHLLLRIETGEFSKRMHAFATGFSKAINKQYERSGALFQGRFQAKHVDDDGYLAHLSRYIHLNPVEAQLVPAPDNWEFSSYRDYLGLRNGTLSTKEIILRDFASVDHYRCFGEEGPRKQSSLIRHLMIEESQERRIAR